MAFDGKKAQELIEECISLTLKTERLSESKREEFLLFLRQIADEKGIKIKLNKMIAGPEPFLIAASDLGLVRKREQKVFVQKIRMVRELDNLLWNFVHRSAANRKLLVEISQLPFNERAKLLSPENKALLEMYRLEKELEKFLRPGFERQAVDIKVRQAVLSNDVFSVIKNRLERSISTTHPLTALRTALNDERLSSREKDIMQRHIEVLEGKRPERSARSIQRPWSLRDRGSSIDFFSTVKTQKAKRRLK